MANAVWVGDDNSVIDFAPYGDGDGWTKYTGKAATIAKRDAARRKLAGLLTPGQTVYTSCTHISRSGMMRHIKVCIIAIDRDGKPYIRNISALTADAIGFSTTQAGDIKVGGCGMDMGFHVVYSLGSAVWRNGTPEPHGTRNGCPDSDGGYALKQQWL
jgi:hypothetical protein